MRRTQNRHYCIYLLTSAMWLKKYPTGVETQLLDNRAAFFVPKFPIFKITD